MRKNIFSGLLLLLFVLSFLLPGQSVFCQDANGAEALPDSELFVSKESQIPEVHVESGTDLQINKSCPQNPSLSFRFNIILTANVEPEYDENGDLAGLSSSFQNRASFTVTKKTKYTYLDDGQEITEFYDNDSMFSVSQRAFFSSEEEMLNTLHVGSIEEIRKLEEKTGNTILEQNEQEFAVHLPISCWMYTNLQDGESLTIHDIFPNTSYEIAEWGNGGWKSYTSAGDDDPVYNEDSTVKGVVEESVEDGTSSQESININFLNKKDTSPLEIKKISEEEEKDYVFNLKLTSKVIQTAPAGGAPCPPWSGTNFFTCRMCASMKDVDVSWKKYNGSAELIDSGKIDENEFMNLVTFTDPDEAKNYIHGILSDLLDQEKGIIDDIVDYEFQENGYIEFEITHLEARETFTLKAGEYIVFDIPEGVEYEVSEILSPEDKAQTKVEVNGPGVAGQDGDSMSGTLDQETTVAFTNTHIIQNPFTVKKVSKKKDIDYNFKIKFSSKIDLLEHLLDCSDGHPCPPPVTNIPFFRLLIPTLPNHDIKWEKYSADEQLKESGYIKSKSSVKKLDFSDNESAEKWLDDLGLFNLSETQVIKNNWKWQIEGGEPISIDIPQAEAEADFILQAGEYIIFDVPENVNYQISEIVPADEKIKVEIDGAGTKDSGGISGVTAAESAVTFTNTIMTDIAGKKTWNVPVGTILPESITIRLHAGGKEVETKTITAAENWKWEFSDLLKYDKDGELILYTITEDRLDNYNTEINGFNVTNTFDPGKTSISVSKVWDDDYDRDGARPSAVKVYLLADGAEAGQFVELSEGSEWQGEFTELPEYNISGDKIVYTVREETPEGYVSVSGGDAMKGFVLTNTHLPETVEITGKKTWNVPQGTALPESIIIRLHTDGEEIAEKTITAADNWEWKFDGLPKYENRVPVLYTITEDRLDNYDTVIDGFNVINTFDPGNTSLSVSKIWDDHQDQDGLRPESVAVSLLADGVDTGKSCVLNAENSWSCEFRALPEINETSAEIKYTIKENEVPGYTVKISGDSGKGFTIKNYHQPETVEIPVRKIWDDENNKKGIRPEFIIIRLFSGEHEVDYHALNAEGNWQWTFSGLPKYDGGKEVSYTLKEDAVTDYNVTITGGGESGFTVTNRTDVPPEEPEKPDKPEKPEKPQPDIPEFFRIKGELPHTGLTGTDAFPLSKKSASVNYVPANMELLIPGLGLSSRIVEVPRMNGDYPVKWLGMDAGLLEGSALPGEGMTVLAGHNTLNAEEYGPFAGIALIEEGDRFFIRKDDGHLLTYLVYANEKIGAADGDALTEISSRYANTVTLLTCEDERIEGGYASRRIVSARLLNQ